MERTRERSREGRDDDRGGRDRGGRGESEGRSRGRGDDDRGGRSRGDDDRGGRGGRGGGSRFQYQKRDPSSVAKRGEQGGGDFDKYIDDSLKMFKPADGDNLIRILPPTWDNADHFGLDTWVHYGIGPDSQTYLCLDKMKGEACPICDERARAVKDGDTAYADKLKPTKRVLVYLIDRNSEKDGPVVWSMPWTIDRDLCKLVVDKRSGEVLPIDDPQNGYDIEFERKGKGDRTQYIGLAIARRESDVGNDRWLDQIQDLPLPQTLKYYAYDHINHVFGGQADGVSSRDSGGRNDRSKDSDLDREQDAGLREVETRGDRNRNRRSSSDDLSYEQVHEMTFDELCSLIDSKDLDIKPDDSKDDAELADWVCEDLKLTKATARRSVEQETRGKLDEMRTRRRSVE